VHLREHPLVLGCVVHRSLASQVITNVTAPFSYLVVALVIIQGGDLGGAKPNPKSVLTAFEGEGWENHGRCEEPSVGRQVPPRRPHTIGGLWGPLWVLAAARHPH
jgi:hypothetical protein